MTKWLGLIVGGALGTVARYLLSGVIYQFTGAGFPYGTMGVNLLGCFVVGFLACITEEKFLLGPNARILLMIGFCGAFTTFSTFILETSHLIRDGESIRAFWNVILSVTAGFLLFRVGYFAGEWV